MKLYGIDEDICFSDEYYDEMGGLPKSRRIGIGDYYRYRLVNKYLSGKSVLDVGSYYGDFLQIAKKNGYEINGTEINKKRVNIANGNLGGEYVKIDFHNGKLSKFNDSSIDTVICMEVIEHTGDDKLAVKELLRVAKKRVIITVPYNEKVRTLLCVHCCNYTPISGHLHSGYNENSFVDYLPENWEIVTARPFNSIFTNYLSKIIPLGKIYFFDPIFSRVFKSKNVHILYIFEKNK